MSAALIPLVIVPKSVSVRVDVVWFAEVAVSSVVKLPAWGSPVTSSDNVSVVLPPGPSVTCCAVVSIVSSSRVRLSSIVCVAVP